MSDFEDEDGSLVELNVVKPKAKMLIERIDKMARGTPRNGKLQMVELLGVLEFTANDKSSLGKARKPVSLEFKNAESGKFTSLGDAITIPKIPGIIFFNVGLILSPTITGDLQLSKNKLALKNIKGIKAKLGLTVNVDQIIITPGKVVIY
ncbi:hypothetical protein MNBD_GAMMA09-3660 [hydrothermal vent metagenome]|uniref:Uncharacterized protein n=1 Tax=hydrothermal vent metagenome TaxID=652676 RepID=A0A3B0XKJ3_9ZZZZ